ncbi:MAG: lysophospholipid acyltransferase family protein [Blastocatellia bacterium]
MEITASTDRLQSRRRGGSIRRLRRLLVLLIGSLWALLLMSVLSLACWPLPRLGWRVRIQAIASWVWCRFVVWTLGIRWRIEGQEWRRSVPRATLIVSNHLSYLDVVLIGSLSPTIFVAKQEVAGWPLLGWLVQLGGTLFLERGSTASSVQCLYRASRLLRSGQSVAVFPEGTTSEGRELSTFHPFFLAAAIRSRREILPLTLRVDSIEGQEVGEDGARAFSWVGDDDFLPHFWNLLTLREVEVRVVVHAPLLVSRQDRAARLAPQVAALIEGPLDREQWAGLPRALSPVGPADEPREVAVEFLAGALLLALLASPQGDALVERWSEGESAHWQGGQE